MLGKLKNLAVMRLYQLAINDFQLRKVNFSDHFTSLPDSQCQYRQFFLSMVSLCTQYRKIFSYFFQNSGTFITFNLSGTLERHLLEEIRYVKRNVTESSKSFSENLTLEKVTH